MKPINNLKEELIKRHFRDQNGKLVANNSTFRDTFINKALSIEDIEIISTHIKDIFGKSFSLADSIKIICMGFDYLPRCKTCDKPIELKFKSGWKKYCSMKCCQNDPEVKAKNLKGQSSVDWGDVVSKREATMVERYGVSSASQLQENKENIARRSKEYYSDPENVLAAEEARKKTNLEKYGVEYRSSDREFHANRMKTAAITKASRSAEEKIDSIDKYRVSTIGQEKFDLLNNRDYLVQKYVIEKKSSLELAYEIMVSKDAIKYALSRAGIELDVEQEIRKVSRSVGENELYEFVRSIRPTAIPSVRFSRKEVDIYIPEMSLGIEYNGVYWHSELNVGSNYHQEKCNILKQNGVRVIQIWEDDWQQRKDVVKARLMNILSPAKRIGARQTKVVELSQSEFDLFVDSTHMQGSTICGVRLGLERDGKIVSAMGFKKIASNVRGSGGWVLVRFANTNIDGAFGKLISRFEKEYQPSMIRSYADLEIVSETTNIYLTNKFIEVSRLAPDYKYFNPVTKMRECKTSWRKSKFLKLGIDIIGKTEKELAQELRLIRCYDSGKIVYEKKYH